MKVIDISDWNDHINWSHMFDEGVEGVIVKSAKGARFPNFMGSTSRQPAPAAFHGAFTATRTPRQPNEQKKRRRSSLKPWKPWDTTRRLWEFGSM